MLVLSRKVFQEIVINVPPGSSGEIRIKVVDLRRDKTRLGISAPTNIGVHRLELYEAIQRGEKQDDRDGREETKEIQGAEETQGQEVVEGG